MKEIRAKQEEIQKQKQQETKYHISKGKGIMNMKTCLNKTAKERYESYRKIALLVAVCWCIYLGIQIYEWIIGAAESNNTLFMCTSSLWFSLACMNMKKAKEEMEKENEN